MKKLLCKIFGHNYIQAGDYDVNNGHIFEAQPRYKLCVRCSKKIPYEKT